MFIPMEERRVEVSGRQGIFLGWKCEGVSMLGLIEGRDGKTYLACRTDISFIDREWE